MHVAAAISDIDPAPISAWVILAAGVIGLGVTATVLVGWFWKRIGIPDVREVVRTELNARDAAHGIEHAKLTSRVDDLDERVEAADQARSTSIARVHDRIDKVHIRIDGLRGPST